MKKWFLVAMLFICSVFVSTQKAAAQTEGSITDSSYYRNALTEKIPADNAFIMRKGDATTIDKLSGVVTNERIVTGLDSVKESSALIRNVGYYHGQRINIRVTVKML